MHQLSDSLISDYILISYDNVSSYILPASVVFVVLTVITAIFMVKNAANRKQAEVYAIGICIRAVIYCLGEMALFVDTRGLPFAGVYIADFVVLKWSVNGK